MLFHSLLLADSVRVLVFRIKNFLFKIAIRQRATIKKAMDKISDNTCVKFRPRRRNENDYVDIQNKINEG